MAPVVRTLLLAAVVALIALQARPPPPCPAPPPPPACPACADCPACAACPACPPPPPPLLPPVDASYGITFYLWARAELGLGVAGRSFLRSLAKSGIPTRICDAQTVFRIPHTASDAPLQAVLDESAATGGKLELADCTKPNPHFINLWGVGPDLIGPVIKTFYDKFGFDPRDGRINVAWWFWEMEQFPANILDIFNSVDEIWAPTTFIAQAFRHSSQLPVSVHIPPLPVRFEPPVTAERTLAARKELGLEDRGFYFLYSFDCHSTTVRKNPVAVLRAFLKAFPAGSPEDPDRRPRLLLKSTHCDSAHHTAARDWNEVSSIAEKDPRIRLISKHLPEDKVGALFAAADAYASLHRAEGFGLGMLQMLAHGRPVVATNYSGNVDFMREDFSYLVPYGMKENSEDVGAYKKGYKWAEPSVDAAAEAMKRIVEHPEEAAEKGRKAREWVLRELGLEKTAAKARKRADELWRVRAAVVAVGKERRREY
ncbi:hypothetical protein DFJ74DRAFT_680201 [Hyaloraphidium curvatum]|nr:hypothetical protein DFJ74DRAFT_680201 [Hyaloraphidium curvatum]